MFVKSPYDGTNLVSEITSTGMHKVKRKFDINNGCIGSAYKTKQIVIEEKINNANPNYKNYPKSIRNSIAVPIFNEQKNIIGVFEILNSQKSAFDSSTNTLLAKFSKYISLLFYTNGLFRVL